jgi:hypothetical protein
MTAHHHKWQAYCDCRDHPPEVERNCCCVNDTEDESECWKAPIYLCLGCGARKDAA